MKRKKVLITTAALLLVGGAGFAYWRMGGDSPQLHSDDAVPRGNIRRSFRPRHLQRMVRCTSPPGFRTITSFCDSFASQAASGRPAPPG